MKPLNKIHNDRSIKSEIYLQMTKRTDIRLLQRMRNHYSHPKGFVGRSICYAILYDSIYYGHIVGGSATRFLPGRDEFLFINIEQLDQLDLVVNNIFYNISKVDESYPIRNFTSQVLKKFMKVCSRDWTEKYGDPVIGFETLVEQPRVGTLYLRAGWKKWERRKDTHVNVLEEMGRIHGPDNVCGTQSKNN